MSKSGGEPEPEPCRQPLPVGLQRLSDGWSEMSLGILSGRRLSPSVCDLALVGNARQEVRAGTAAPAGGSGKQALVSYRLWTEDVDWPNWGALPGLGDTSVPVDLCGSGVCRS